MMRALAGLIVLLLIAAGAVYIVARRETVPIVRIEQPGKAIGQAGTLVVTAEAPKAKFKALTVAVEQNGKSTPLFSLDSPELAKAAATSPAAPDQITITRPIGKLSVPELRSGTARIVVSATRPSFLSLRTLSASASKDIQVRLEPPAIAVRLDPSLREPRRVGDGGLSRDAGRRASRACGSAMSSIRAFPRRAPAWPAPTRRVRVAFFALLYNQDLPHADRRLRARRSRQRGDRAVHRQRLPQAAEAQPHRARRSLRRARRAGNPRALARAENGAARARRRLDHPVSGDQRRAAS